MTRADYDRQYVSRYKMIDKVIGLRRYIKNAAAMKFYAGALEYDKDAYRYYEGVMQVVNAYQESNPSVYELIMGTKDIVAMIEEYKSKGIKHPKQSLEYELNELCRAIYRYENKYYDKLIWGIAN